MYLGIDFGLKKIGLAISEGMYASPLETLPNNPNFIGNLRTLLKGQTPEKIIIGRPPKSPNMELFEKFTQHLINNFPESEIITEDEDYTTRESHRRMYLSGFSKKNRQQDDNAMAACIILERYLENN